jgi:NADH dehydrogenase
MKPTERGVPRIIVVGGGVAGLILATRLGHLLGRRGLVRVSLIDRSWIHVWKPMLHTFAAGTWNLYEQQVQYVAHARTHHFEYIPGQLDAIDRATRRIRLAPLQMAGEAIAGARELGYDVLVLAFGSRANDFSTSGRTWCAASSKAATSTSPSSAAAPIAANAQNVLNRGGKSLYPLEGETRHSA